MTLAIWLALPLLGGSPDAQPPALPQVELAAADEYTDLEAAFEEELANWKQAIKDGDRDARKELRANHPVAAFWPRFQTQAENGAGRAYLWLAGNVKKGPIEKADRGAHLNRYYAALVKDHTGAEWFSDAVRSIYRNRKSLGNEPFSQLLSTVMNGAEIGNEVRAEAGYHLATAWMDLDDEADVARGKALMASLPEKFPGTQWAGKAEAGMITEADLLPGKVAPDFHAKTIDGHEFKLSDYRGKVVLLDFYGFW